MLDLHVAEVIVLTVRHITHHGVDIVLVIQQLLGAVHMYQ